MRRVAALLGGALLAAAAATADKPVAAGAGNAHDFMADETRCADCHRVVKEGKDWVLDPHIFTVSVVAACRGCHPVGEMGRSHPVGSDPTRARPRIQVPPELPLQWSDDARGEVMTCGTCHDPHLPRFDRRKLHGRQKPHPRGKGQYLTYYLRLRGDDARDGYTKLCRACHPHL